MVLSRRVSVLLVALVVAVMALGIMGVLRAVSASPNNNADNPNHSESEARTLTVLVKPPEARVVDLGPQGATHGDMRVINALVYNESGKKKLGRFDLFSVVTDPADEPAEKEHIAEVTATYTLPGGEISAQGVNTFPKLYEFPPPRGGVEAITGGTGKYAGVRGELRYGTRGNKAIHTFHFID